MQLRLTPGGRANRIDGLMRDADGGLLFKAQVTAAPEKGKANQALARLLAKEWGVAKSAVTIAAGETARAKTLLVRGDGPALMDNVNDWYEKKGFSRND